MVLKPTSSEHGEANRPSVSDDRPPRDEDHEATHPPLDQLARRRCADAIARTSDALAHATPLPLPQSLDIANLR